MTARTDTHALSDGLCRPYSRTVSSGLVYYPPTTSRPRSHSTGSPVGSSTSSSSSSTAPTTAKRTTIKIVMGKNYAKNGGGSSRAFEELKRQQCQNNGSSTTSTSRYKTELCRPYQEYRVCKYGDKCQFAHGEHDLRVLPRHPKYKTELCRTYHAAGFCPYGPRCHFIHNLDEARNPSDTPPCSPVKKTATGGGGLFSSTAHPISPSVDSGISSPDGFSGGGGTGGGVGPRSFEFPIIGAGSQGSSGSSGMGSDEGGDDRYRGHTSLRNRYTTYSPLNGDCSSDLEASESGIQVDYLGPSELSELDTLPSSSSYDSCSPLIPLGGGSGGGGGGFNMPSDPALDLQNILSGLGIRDAPPLPPPSPCRRRLSPPPLFSAVPLTQPPGSPASAASARRLPVFDDMMGHAALLLGFASDPGRQSSFPTFP